MLDMWTTPGQVTNIPAANSELRFDTHLIENASFLRLKNLTIGYTLPENWLHKTGFIKGARIFAVGRNLLTVTNYTGADPEVDSNLQLGEYPNTLIFDGIFTNMANISTNKATPTTAKGDRQTNTTPISNIRPSTRFHDINLKYTSLLPKAFIACKLAVCSGKSIAVKQNN